MMRNKLSQIAAALALAGASMGASATLLTSDASYTGPSLNLSGYDNGNYNFTFGPAPIIGGITFTRDPSTPSNSGNGGVLGQGGYGLASNGSFGGNAVYAGLDGANGWMRFTLSAPVSQFGLYVNYAPGVGGDPMIAALDSSNNVIESHDLATEAPVVTPNGFNQFEFRGIELSGPLIWTLELSNSYLIAAGAANGGIPTPTVPEPESLALVALGLLGLGLARRRKAM